MKNTLFLPAFLTAICTAVLVSSINVVAQNTLAGVNQTTLISNSAETTNGLQPAYTATPKPVNGNASFADYDPDDIDYDAITKRDQLPKPIIPGYDRYSAARAIDKKSHEEAMKKAFSSDDARERWADVFKRIYEGK